MPSTRAERPLPEPAAAAPRTAPQLPDHPTCRCERRCLGAKPGRPAHAGRSRAVRPADPKGPPQSASVTPDRPSPSPRHRAWHSPGPAAVTTDPLILRRQPEYAHYPNVSARFGAGTVRLWNPATGQRRQWRHGAGVGRIAIHESVCHAVHRRRPSHPARVGSVRPRRAASPDLRL